MEEIKWLQTVHQAAPLFLERLKGQTKPGFYRYSLTGDLYGENTRWGLGNTVFAAKAYFTLGRLHTLPAEEREAIINGITAFRRPSGFIYDPLVRRLAVPFDLAMSFRYPHNIWHTEAIRAETRQAYSALLLLGEKRTTPTEPWMRQASSIVHRLASYKWQHPWDSGSHFSHLLFFLHQSDVPNKHSLIAAAVAWIHSIQHTKDGAWYTGNPSLAEKINGAMKVMTGLRVLGQPVFPAARALIDLCLTATNDRAACDNFNIIYVLNYCRALEPGYRESDMRRFCLDRLAKYRQYYYPDLGGFSFRLGQANDRYYGARISRGLAEPDIHGTVLFLWGISVIVQMLGIADQFEFQEFVT